MRVGKRVLGAISFGFISVASLTGLSGVSAQTVGPTPVIPSTSTSVAAAAVGTPLFVNLGPVPFGVKVGVQQTVFQFVHAGSPSGPTVAGMPVHFDVISGPNAGQRGVVVTSESGSAIFRFSTTNASPRLGSTDMVRAWLDLNDNGLFDVGEPTNANPFFTLPAPTVNGALACEGRAATIVLEGSKTVAVGTGGPDVIVVFSDRAQVYAHDGDDVVCVWGADPSVYLDNGNDRVLLERGNATVYANDGDDYVQANTGNNLIYGGSGNDSVFVGDGDNVVWGGSGDDNLFSGIGKTLLSGDSGVDRITSLGGSGTYWGGEGNDAFDIAGRRYNS